VRLLLDTHAFLWWVDDSRRLSRKARAAIANRDSACYLSLASVWEMAIKVSVDRLKLPSAVDRFVSEQMAANAFEALPIDLRHASDVARLPFHHRDPFDRLLVAQALSEALAIVSADPVFAKYGVKRVW
jgi:PIN domain nuclease of toxin-antitoxin system